MHSSLGSINTRTSVRSYDGAPLRTEDLEAIRKAFEDSIPTPFGNRPRFAIVSAPSAGMGTSEAMDEVPRTRSGKIGTYGLIKNAPAFVIGAVAKAPFALEDFGYALEGIILRATELGLGTCWIGGIFDRPAARRALNIADGELLPAVVSIGRAADRMSFAEKITRLAAKSESRKPFGSLFYEGNFENPLSPEKAGAWAAVLEAVRKGPSASNKQPWRIVCEGVSTAAPVFHLYLEEDPFYNNALGEIHIQNIDMGIAMRHFETAAHALNLPGLWGRLPNDLSGAVPPRSYIATWRA